MSNPIDQISILQIKLNNIEHSVMTRKNVEERSIFPLQK